MRKKTLTFLHLFEFLIIFIAISIFIFANPKTLRYIANTAASEYGLKYDKISGNLLSKIYIKNIRYKNRLLAKEANVEFNILKLIDLTIDIKKVDFRGVDLDNFSYFLTTFKKEAIKSKQTKKKINFKINIKNITFDILPYKEDDIKIDRLVVFIKDFKLDEENKKIDINNHSVVLNSNIADINYFGSFSNKILNIDYLNIEKLDIKNAFLLKKFIKKKSDSNESKIKKVIVKKAFLSTKSFKKGKYKLDFIYLDIKDAATNLKDINISSINIKSKTNIWKLVAKGEVKNSVAFLDTDVTLDNKYFKRFIKDIDFNSLNPVKVKLKINKDKLEAKVKAKSKKLFDKRLSFLEAKLKDLRSEAVFYFRKLNLYFDVVANIDTKYSKNIKVNGDFFFDPKKKIFYKGDVFVKKLQNLDPRIKLFLENSKINFKGYKTGIEANLTNKMLKVDYDSLKSYITPEVFVTSKPFTLKSIDENISKISKIKDINLSFNLESKLNYKKIQSTKIKYKIFSDLFDIDGKFFVKDKNTSFNVKKSKKDLLSKIDKNIQTQNLFPLRANASFLKDKIDFLVLKDDLNIKGEYFKTKDFKIDLLENQNTKISIKKEKDYSKYTLKTNILKDFLTTIGKYYHLPSLNIDGQIDLEAESKDGVLTYVLNSKWFLYEYQKYKYFFLENSALDGYIEKNQIFIQDYISNAFILERYRKLYSTKLSKITIDKKIDINIFVNDQINIKGYIFPKKETRLKIFSNRFFINEPEAKLYVALNLDFLSTPLKSSLRGKVKLLSGVIKYKPRRFFEISDEDIVFVNQQKNKNVDGKNFDIFINIIAKKGIKYKLGKNYAIFVADLTLFKKNKENLKYYGYVKILDGIYYAEEKRFELGKGEILFGGNLLNPYLNLKAYYKRDPYKITILIGGTLEAPILNFTSTPTLTQNDILSMLLFNTKVSSLTNSKNNNQNPAISLFGSTFAKEIMNTIGIKLDRVVLSTTEDGSIGFEIEKRISDKITIIYQNDLVQTIKIKYRNSNKIETDLTFSPDSSGIDIIFKSEH